MNTLNNVLITARKAIYTVIGLLDSTLLHQSNSLFVLSYHSVAHDTWRFSVDVEMIKKQILYLKEHFDIISIGTLEAYIHGATQLTRPSVVLTFDDGYKDILTLKDFLAEHAIKPALFVLANPQNPNWKELGTKREFLSTADIKAVHKLGWEIGCHSATHANLATLTDAELAKEIVGSKQLLEKELGFPLPYFAYPRGKYSPNVLRFIQKAKYTLAFTMDDGFINVGSETYTLPRVGIDRTHSFSEFRSTFSPSVVRLRQMVKKSPAGKYL